MLNGKYGRVQERYLRKVSGGTGSKLGYRLIYVLLRYLNNCIAIVFINIFSLRVQLISCATSLSQKDDWQKGLHEQGNGWTDI